ncbi:MAG: SO2930 family diheme c-type cytochrome, partial [Pirellula sp.]
SLRRRSKYRRLLSEYQLFQGNLANLQPAEGVTEYEVNTSLFSDYSAKQRLVRLPEETTARYDANETFDFPVGTMIAKTFYYPADMNDSAKGRRLVETRIMLHEESGWVGLPYVWNAEQSDAELSVVGATVDVRWVHHDGKARSNSHIVPNLNDCKRCHQSETMAPIGPTARNLNRVFVYEHGSENQLAYWARSGLLRGAPEPVDAPKLAVWDDPQSGALDARARAWLEVNCAHCHHPEGPARNSGLHLSVSVTDPYQLGIFKTPVAAGKGTGGRMYSIVPGKPDESIMLYRLETTHPGSMMPEFGRSLVHEESVTLIREWIAGMDTIRN